jgi:hypothetical protein
MRIVVDTLDRGIGVNLGATAADLPNNATSSDFSLLSE